MRVDRTKESLRERISLMLRGSPRGGPKGSSRINVPKVAKQIVSNVGDPAYEIARRTSLRLLSVRRNGLLYGPRSPYYEVN